MQFIRKCEEAALNQKNQAQIYRHYVAAILSLETIPGGGGVEKNLEECGDSLWRVVPWVFLPLSMDDFRTACSPSN